MVSAIQLCVMASAKSCKRKTRGVSDSSEQVVEADALDSSAEVVLDSPSDAAEIFKDLQLLPVRTRPKSTCRGSSDTEKSHGDGVKNEDDECFFTPKAEETKIGEITTCPHAPRKPKSIPRKRNPTIAPRALFIPSDSPDLEEFFANHCENTKKKQKGSDLSV